MSSRRRKLAALALLLGAALATFLLAGLHQHHEATRRLDAANAAFVKKQWRAAADEAHAAALRAWPGSDVQREAFALLEHTARSASAAGDVPATLVAWTEMRHAAIAVRSVASDTSGWQDEAEEGVRATSTASDLPSVHELGEAPSQAVRLTVGAAVLLGVIAIAALSSRRLERPS